MDRARRAEELRGWAIDFAVATAAGVFLGAIGPFGNFLSGPAWQRILYWVGVVWLGVLTYGGAARLILSRNPSPLMAWVQAAAASLLVSAPFAALVSVIATRVWPSLATIGWAGWYLQVLVISLPLMFGQMWVARARWGRRLASEARREPPSRHGLLGVAPGEVLCLQMEDHYVRVHTVGGSRLVLATLGQAMAALGRDDGLQVHRSWWVARKAMVRAVAEGRNLRLELRNGLTAPVARSAVAAVRAAGWLDESASQASTR